MISFFFIVLSQVLSENGKDISGIVKYLWCAQYHLIGHDLSFIKNITVSLKNMLFSAKAEVAIRDLWILDDEEVPYSTAFTTIHYISNISGRLMTIFLNHKEFVAMAPEITKVETSN